MVKKCSKCEEEFTLSEFHKHARTNDGLQPYCKTCNKISNNNSYRNKEARKHYPTPFKIGVYAIKDGDEIVYIGSSDILSWRLYQHFGCYNSFDDGLNKLQRKVKYTWHIIWHGDNLEDAVHMEKLNIQTFQPKFNKILYKNYES